MSNQQQKIGVGVGIFIVILITIFLLVRIFRINSSNDSNEFELIQEEASEELLDDSESDANIDNTILGEQTMSENNKVGRHDVLSGEEINKQKSIITTSKGVIEVELFGDAPLASSNHIGLANEDFYSGLTFHRREEGFVIQGGDPTGTGAGGPGYDFADEDISEKDYPRDTTPYGEVITYPKGTVAMANAGPNTNGSQYFIMLGDVQLPPSYTIFGKVISGLDVVEKIQVGDTMDTVEIVAK